MIDPNAELAPDDRVSVPVALLNAIYATLAELPARQSMDILLAIKDQAEIIQPSAAEKLSAVK